MDYTISKTKRNLIIFSAVFLILKAIVLVVVFNAIDSTRLEVTLRRVDRILQTVACGYIIFVLVQYFRHYKLKTLQFITLAILLIDVANNTIQFSILAGMNVAKHDPLVSALIWVFLLFLWIIFLFRIPAANFPALISIRKYAVSILAIVILGGFIPFFIDDRQYFEFLAPIIVIIPYFFIVEFALKPNSRARNSSTNTH